MVRESSSAAAQAKARPSKFHFLVEQKKLVRRYAKQKSLPPNWSKLLMNVHSRRGVSLAELSISDWTQDELDALYRHWKLTCPSVEELRERWRQGRNDKVETDRRVEEALHTIDQGIEQLASGLSLARCLLHAQQHYNTNGAPGVVAKHLPEGMGQGYEQAGVSSQGAMYNKQGGPMPMSHAAHSATSMEAAVDGYPYIPELEMSIKPPTNAEQDPLMTGLQAFDQNSTTTVHATQLLPLPWGPPAHSVAGHSVSSPDYVAVATTTTTFTTAPAQQMDAYMGGNRRPMAPYNHHPQFPPAQHEPSDGGMQNGGYYPYTTTPEQFMNGREAEQMQQWQQSQPQPPPSDPSMKPPPLPSLALNSSLSSTATSPAASSTSSLAESSMAAELERLREGLLYIGQTMEAVTDLLYKARGRVATAVSVNAADQG